MLINCHTHTKRSHDSAAEPAALCESAVKAGLAGLTFTDHCDCEYHKSVDIIRQFAEAAADYESAKKKYEDRLRLFFGIELGDPLFAPAFADKILSSFSFDAVLLSVHAVRFPGYDIPFSQIDFGFADDRFIFSYLNQYFTDLLESVCIFDFDILCHLTVPLRYINLKYGKKADISGHMDLIDRILKEVIARDKTLEINTSALSLHGGFLMPDQQIIDRYIAFGGSSFSVGSDAHSPAQIADGLKEAAQLLKKNNIKSLCCYRGRQRLFYDL